MAIRRLPNLGENSWGELLNNYLLVSHDPDGSVKTWNNTASRPVNPDAGTTGVNLQTGKTEKYNGTSWFEISTTKTQQLRYNRSVPNSVEIDAQEWFNNSISAVEFGLNLSRNDNQVAITNAMNYVNATFGGGTVYLPNGVFTINGPIIMPEKVRLMGQSSGKGYGTRITLANGTNKNMIEFNQTQATRYCGIENLMLDGNKANNTTGHGIYLYSPDWRAFYPLSIDAFHTFRDIRIENTAEDGINSNSIGGVTFPYNSGSQYEYFNVRSCHFANIVIRNPGKLGFNLTKVTDSTFFDIVCYGCGSEGFKFAYGANSHVYYMKTFYNNKNNLNAYGVNFTNSQRCVLVGLEPQEEYFNGVKIESCTDFNLSNCIFDANGRPLGTNIPTGTSTAAPGTGLIIKNSNYVNGTSLIFTSFHNPSWQGVGVKIEGSGKVSLLGCSSQNQITADYQLVGTANTNLMIQINGVFRENLNVAGNVQTTGGDFNSGHLLLGSYHIWVGTDGNLRMKNSAPTSSLDGSIIGTQT